jgi:glucose-6-phosphate-specific signal transduction histidine kinase
MPKEIQWETFEDEIAEALTPEAREWVARLLHDHVSGLITNLAMQVEIISKMMSRDMPIQDEMVSLKENVSAASNHIKTIEKMIRPPRE